MTDFTLKYDGAAEQLVGEDPNGNKIPIPLDSLDVSGSASADSLDVSGSASADSLDVSGSASIDGNVEPFAAGHDDVRVPQVQNLTVEDWESGTLDTDVWTSLFSSASTSLSVQSSVVDTGQYALKSENGSSGRVGLASLSGLKSYPQSGDTVSLSFYLTDGADEFRLGIGKQGEGEFDDGYNIQVKSFSIRITEHPSDNFSNDVTSVDNNLNEWLTLTVEWGTDDQITASITNASGTEIGSVSHTIASDFYDSGGVGIYPRNKDTAFTQYFDNLTVKRREPEARANTQKGVTELGNEVVPSGSIQTGPMEVPADHPNYPMVNLPVTDDLAQGEQVGYHLGINQDKALTVEAEADGNGGIQNQTLSVPSLQPENLEAKKIGGSRLYAGGYSGADADARLDAALADATTGDVIYLESEKYLTDRTINKSVSLKGPNANFGFSSGDGARLSAQWTLAGNSIAVDSLNLQSDTSFGLLVTGRICRVSNIVARSDVSRGFVEFDANNGILTQSSFCQVTITSNADGTVVTGNSQVAITDNGTNTQLGANS